MKKNSTTCISLTLNLPKKRCIQVRQLPTYAKLVNQNGTVLTLSNWIPANQNRDFEKLFFVKCSVNKTEQDDNVNKKIA